MPPVITITGESGKGWNATAQTPDALGLSTLVLTRGSLEQDSLKATRKVRAYDLSGWPVPTLLQQVTVSRDGTPIWKGWITKVQPRVGDGIRPRLEIEASGVWWWMKKQPLASTRQNSGFISSSDRPQFAVASGTELTAALNSLLTAYNARFNAGDARRVTVGTMAPAFPIPLTRISGSDFLSALAELLRFCPDSMAWWDTPATGHNAIFRMSRRATAAIETLNFGVDHISSADFEPKPELQLTDGVRIDYARIINDQGPNTGKPEYLAQASSGYTAGAQRIVVSGPESDTFLPATPTDSATISSVSINQSFIQQKDSGLAAIPGMANYGALLMYNLSVRDPKTGANLLASYPYALVSSSSPADWWSKLPTPISWRDADISATMQLFNSGNFDLTYGLNLNQTTTYPWGSYQRATGYNAYGYAEFTTYALSEIGWRFLQIAAISQVVVNLARAPASYQAATAYWGTYSAKLSGTMINLPLTNATFYRPPDYDFIAPPANLAANLAAAQNYLPWEGTLGFPNPNIGDRAFSGKILRIGGGPPEWATMTAMVTTHTLDFFSLHETVTCGLPSRLSSLNLTQKVRPNGQANISYL